jgi:hypothetical protein
MLSVFRGHAAAFELKALSIPRFVHCHHSFGLQVPVRVCQDGRGRSGSVNSRNRPERRDYSNHESDRNADRYGMMADGKQS